MNVIDERIEELLSGKVSGELSSEEERELECWLEASEENRQQFRHTVAAWERLLMLKADFHPDVQLRLKELKKRTRRRKPLTIGKFMHYASLWLILVGTASFLIWSVLFSFTKEKDNREFASISKPGKEQALLQMADGEKIELDVSVLDTILYRGVEATLKVDTDRMLHYNAVGVTTKQDTATNLLITPKGGEYRIVLEDGSIVWLNSLSVLKFPFVFGQEERRVKFSGEGYFQIHPDSKRPFIVETGEVSVRALGTTFNLTTYEKERVATTLVSGSVEVVTAKGERAVLKPGQQALLSEEKLSIRTVDIAYITSWMDGKFNFDNTTLEEISAQISRWYDVDIIFGEEHLKSIRFSGSIQKFRPLGDLIDRIEATSNARFSVKGNSIVIVDK